MRHHASGFFLLELIIAILIAILLASMGAVAVPKVQDQSRQVESLNNVRNMAQIMTERSIGRGWPKYDGKNFVLSLVAYSIIDPDNPENLRVFFSPADVWYSHAATDHERYKEITREALKAGQDFHELTSYAGRRNGDREYMLTAVLLRRVVPIICDDDDGPLHHREGLVMAYSDGRAKFVTWEELGMLEQDDPDNPEPFLGDNAPVEALLGLSAE